MSETLSRQRWIADLRCPHIPEGTFAFDAIHAHSLAMPLFVVRIDDGLLFVVLGPFQLYESHIETIENCAIKRRRVMI